jgi:hypothetical protein
MKRSWTVRRTTVGRADAARRWDQAYLHLLRWATPDESHKEVPDARGDLRPGVHPAPSAGPEDRSAGPEARAVRGAEGLGP